jgi:hypothetical protein
MSTRANIIIKDKYGQLIFYRHSDGYPEGALPTLKKLMSWVKDGKIRDNVDQASGWLILIGAEEYGDVYEGGGKYTPKNPIQTMNFPAGTAGLTNRRQAFTGILNIYIHWISMRKRYLFKV